MASKSSDSGDTGIENRIIEIAIAKPDGISNKDIQEGLHDVPAKVWTTVINKLLKSGYVSIYKLVSCFM